MPAFIWNALVLSIIALGNGRYLLSQRICRALYMDGRVSLTSLGRFFATLSLKDSGCLCVFEERALISLIMRLSTFVIAVCFGGAIAVPAPASHVLHEKRDGLHTKWQKRERLDKKAVLPMRVGLKQSNLHNAEELLMDV